MTTPSERLRKYRLETLHLKTKREMAKFLGVSEDVYAKAENGVRTPSKKLLEALFDKTGLGEEYWKYGINQNNPTNTELTATLNIIEELIDGGYVVLNKELTPEIETLLLTALKTDIQHLLLRLTLK